MPKVFSASIEKYKARANRSAIALILLVLFSFTVVIYEEVEDRVELENLVDTGIEARFLSLSSIFDRQVQTNTIDAEHLHSNAMSFTGTASVHWSEIILDDHNILQDNISGGVNPDNIHLEINDGNLAELMLNANTCGALPLVTIPSGNFSLAGCKLHNGNVFAALFYRPQISVRTSRFKENKWLALIALVFAAGAISYLVSRRMLHGSLARLSKALDGAEETLELNLDAPLPNNEIGWLGERIESWLERLKVTQDELEQSSLVAKNTNQSVMVLDANMKVEWANSAFTRLSGFSVAEVMGRSPRQFSRGPKTSTDTIAYVEERINSGQAASYELVSYKKDGTTFWNATELQPIKNNVGEVTGWISILADISEQKAAEKDLATRIRNLETAREEQNKLTAELRVAQAVAESNSRSKSDFLANMSHEIRTPMNGVLGMADVLLTTDLSESQCDYVQTIKDSGSALLTILNDILDLSKLGSGKITLEKDVVELDRLVDSVSDLMKPKAQEKNITVRTTIEEDVPGKILGDGGRLRQILLNLIGNAIKFTEQGEIGISVSLAENEKMERRLKISVVDTGVGIAPEFQKNLFERFEQGGTAGSASGGTGLGLSICRELTWLMGGDIEVASELGQGSTFTLEIPYTAAPNELAATVAKDKSNDKSNDTGTNNSNPASLEENTGQSGLNILLAEDHPVNRSLMKAFVQKLGHNITIAEDGVDTVKALRSGDFDLILMDIQMPRMDGVMATKVIRSLESDKAQIPIIAVTANAMAGQREHYLKSGMNGYVSKPVQLSHLEDEIQRVWAEYNVEIEAKQSVG